MADSYFDFLGENQNKTLRGMNTQSCAIVEHHATLYPNKPTLKTPEDMAMALRDPLLFREVFQTATQQKDEKTVKALKEFAGYELARINAEEQLKAEAEKAKLEAQQKIENSPVNQMLKAAETGAQLGGTEGKLTPPIKP